MSDPQSTAFNALGASIAAALSGFVGMVVGIKVQGNEIENMKERLDRIEAKLDRLIERL